MALPTIFAYIKEKERHKPFLFLLNVFVIADMILTVAVVAATAGAVAELQIRMAHIRASADCTAVGVGDFY